ncbi:AAA family ATPase [Pseudomonas sp. PLMAX]|uniref:AAA family ATPase n=1 Tax=Pseudomonas sp. PLMAX TaxID=2201998 RepID=UPI0038B8ED42
MEHVKLTKIDIKNYRSCVSTNFEPTPTLSALIGPNGSGKTTVLSALQLLIKLHASSNYYRRRSPDPYSSDCVITATFKWHGKNVVYKAQISLINTERNEDEIIAATESWTMPTVIGSRKQMPIPLGALSNDYRYPGQSFRETLVGHIGRLSGNQETAESATQAILDISQFIASISYYSASVFTNPSSSPISFEVEGDSMVRRGAIGVGHKKFLYDLYTAYRDDTEDFKNYCEIIGSDGLNLIDQLTFHAIETSSSTYKVSVGGRITNREKKTNLIVPNFFIYGNALSPSQLSEGTFKTLALIFYIMTNHGSMLLIEEPEVCVHHGLLSSIIELIKSYSHEKQIIISTHSDQLIDHIPLESVFKTTRSEETTSVTNITKELGSEELKALRDYLQNEGGLGQYWKHGEL